MALQALGRIKWRLEQLEATTPSRLGRSGLRPGSRSPDFTLPIVQGGESSLGGCSFRLLLAQCIHNAKNNKCNREKEDAETKRARRSATEVFASRLRWPVAEHDRRMAERALQNIVLAEARAFARMDLVNPEVLT